MRLEFGVFNVWGWMGGEGLQDIDARCHGNN